MLAHSMKRRARSALFTAAALALSLTPAVASARTVDRLFTSDADFKQGSLNNVALPGGGQLELSKKTEPFHFLWVTLWNRGTVVKIDTATGRVLGEYQTSPVIVSPRTTAVDLKGNVWVENHVWATSQWRASVAHIGVAEYGQCVDRNGDGKITTSQGLGDVLPWNTADTSDAVGTGSLPRDECLLHYTPVPTPGALDHISIDAGNNAWVGSLDKVFFQLDGRSGAIMRSHIETAAGGLGGFFDARGRLWSASPEGLLRWNMVTGEQVVLPYPSYQLCVDGMDQIWSTYFYSDTIHKLSPEGRLLGAFEHGNTYGQGCVADRNNNIWVAHADIFGGWSVGILDNYRGLMEIIPVKSGPTNVALDAQGKIWATNYHQFEVARIDPALARNDVRRVTSYFVGDTSNSFGDLTGSMLQSAPLTGSWSVVVDSRLKGTQWRKVLWTAGVPEGGSVTVMAASSEDGVSFGHPWVSTKRPEPELNIDAGRYLKVTVVLSRAPGGMSPTLRDLTVLSR